MPGYAVLQHPWWVPVLWILVLGHITNSCTTLYLHRSATHGGVKFHPVVEHFMRFWVWLTTSAVTKEWVAVHRKHHAHSDREGDPHSPEVEGLWAIVLAGVFFYRKWARDPELLEKYGRGTPEDWVERNLYMRFHTAGIAGMLALDVYLFGIGIGLVAWSFMAIWMPVMGNIINGIGHAKGYRNFDTKDASRNIYPWGIWILGEELHNNHHADPRSAKFKAQWWEFDIGWTYIRILEALRLADVLYARQASVAEFRAKHYAGEEDEERRPREAIGRRLELARENARLEVEEAKERLRAAREGAKEAAREELEEARERLRAAREGVRDELGQAKRKLGEAAARARAGLESPEASAD